MKQIFKFFIGFILFCNAGISQADETLVLSLKTKAYGLVNTYINSSAIKISLSQPHLNIFCVAPDYNIYYVNLDQKNYYLTNINKIPIPPGIIYLKNMYLFVNKRID